LKINTVVTFGTSQSPSVSRAMPPHAVSISTVML